MMELIPCGSYSQENVLRRTAKRQQRDGYTRLYIATDAINAHAIGVTDVPFDAAPRPPRSNLIPGVFLSHLAVDQKQQGKGLGCILLVDAMQQCQRAGQILSGCCCPCTASLGEEANPPVAGRNYP